MQILITTQNIGTIYRREIQNSPLFRSAWNIHVITHDLGALIARHATDLLYYYFLFRNSKTRPSPARRTFRRRRFDDQNIINIKKKLKIKSTTREMKGLVIDGPVDISPKGKFKLNVFFLSYLSRFAACVKLEFYYVCDFNIISLVCFKRCVWRVNGIVNSHYN